MSKASPPERYTGLWKTSPSPADGSWHETEYVDGVPNGAFRYVLASGVAVREGTKRNGRMHGTVIVRDSSGEILDRCEFVDGTGVIRIYTTARRVGWEIPMRAGEVHGVKRQFSSGKVIYEEEYLHGRLHGSVRRFRGDNVVSEEHYEHGQRVDRS